MRLNLLVGALLLAGTATTAWAQGFAPGPYIGLRAGVTAVEDQSLRGVDGNPLSLTTDPEIGFGVLAAGGYSFGWWRLEGEFGYRRNKLDTIGVGADGGIPAAQGLAAQTGTTQSGGGNVNVLSTMGNVIFDLPWSFGGISPYLGVGIGVARIVQDRNAGGLARYVDDTDTKFAYQGIAGLSWNFNPHWSLSLDYRYFAAMDPHFKDSLGRSVDGEYASHNAFLGVTYHFGLPKPAPAPVPVVAPPPPPPPPPPPAPAVRPQPFLVFFDFDRSDITVEADRIIRSAADAWKRGQSTTLQTAVTGHTDRSGSDAYNQALSVRRANAVKARLVQYGVPANVVTTAGRGESEPLVPTADGVREPQNRRAEIVIRQ